MEEKNVNKLDELCKKYPEIKRLKNKILNSVDHIIDITNKMYHLNQFLSENTSINFKDILVLYEYELRLKKDSEYEHIVNNIYKMAEFIGKNKIS